MQRVALIYNPASGQHSSRRTAFVRDALSALRGAGVEADAMETNAPGKATVFAREAISRGYDTILACGGDGTVHEVLQCVVVTPVHLGVVPLGTANALAQNLGLGTDPVKAVRSLLSAMPVEIPVGRIFYQDSAGASQSRFFIVAAGVGADALFMSQLDSGLKRWLGYVLYLAEAVRVWATYKFPRFEVAFTENGSGKSRTVEASQVLAVRIRSFGGILRQLAPGATLHGATLRLLAFKTQSRMHYLKFLLAAVFARHTFTRQVELLDAVTVECRPLTGFSAHILIEADGELLGELPVRMEVVPRALNLLIPADARP